jgi:hypothetical protein
VPLEGYFYQLIRSDFLCVSCDLDNLDDIVISLKQNSVMSISVSKEKKHRYQDGCMQNKVQRFHLSPTQDIDCPFLSTPSYFSFFATAFEL